jgi:hypothetical protein
VNTTREIFKENIHYVNLTFSATGIPTFIHIKTPAMPTRQKHQAISSGGMGGFRRVAPREYHSQIFSPKYLKLKIKIIKRRKKKKRRENGKNQN